MNMHQKCIRLVFFAVYGLTVISLQAMDQLGETLKHVSMQPNPLTQQTALIHVGFARDQQEESSPSEQELFVTKTECCILHHNGPRFRNMAGCMMKHVMLMEENSVPLTFSPLAGLMFIVGNRTQHTPKICTQEDHPEKGKTKDSTALDEWVPSVQDIIQLKELRKTLYTVEEIEALACAEASKRLCLLGLLKDILTPCLFCQALVFYRPHDSARQNVYFDEQDICRDNTTVVDVTKDFCAINVAMLSAEGTIEPESVFCKIPEDCQAQEGDSSIVGIYNDFIEPYILQMHDDKGRLLFTCTIPSHCAVQLSAPLKIPRVGEGVIAVEYAGERAISSDKVFKVFGVPANRLSPSTETRLLVEIRGTYDSNILHWYCPGAKWLRVNQRGVVLCANERAVNQQNQYTTASCSRAETASSLRSYGGLHGGFESILDLF